MKNADTSYLIQEAKQFGAVPVVKIGLRPYYYPPGINANGVFEDCSYVPPDKIESSSGSGLWVSEVLFSRVERPALIVVSWTENHASNTTLYWRTAATSSGLLLTNWESLHQLDQLYLLEYYQFRCEFTLNGAFIAALILEGEYIIIDDIVSGGTISTQMPDSFDELVAGEYSGLTLSNRQAQYSPDKNSFIFAEEVNADWYGRQIRAYLGWKRTDNPAGYGVVGYGLPPGYGSDGYSGRGYGAIGYGLPPGYGSDGWLESYTDFLQIFAGKIMTWGPVSRAIDQDGKLEPSTVEIYARDYLYDSLSTRIAVPDEDGTANPLTFGEFLCKAEPVGAWTPAASVRELDFEDGYYADFDSVYASGGGSYETINPGITGDYAFRAQSSGANQSAYGTVILPTTGDVYITGNIRFHGIPLSPVLQNMVFLEIYDNSAYFDLQLSVGDDGSIYYYHPGSVAGKGYSAFNVLGSQDVILPFALWFDPQAYGHIRLWINKDEVISYDGNLPLSPYSLKLGCITGGVSESWIIDFDDIKIYDTYYFNAFRVTGSPFEGMGQVYVDQVAQPNSKYYHAGEGAYYTQTLTKYAAWGMVHFQSDEPYFKRDGEILVKVIEHNGGQHPLMVIQTLLGLAGLSSYVDLDSVIAAYAACPDDIINARFDPGGTEARGLKDYSSLGMTVGDALIEICSRCLYWIFFDFGSIKITPYIGASPAGPVLAIDGTNSWECNQNIEMENQDSYVAVKYGWYDRDPSLFYVAGSMIAGTQGTELDMTWDAPVCVEIYAMAKAKADLLQQFLGIQETVEPVRIRLEGARLEIGDVVSLNDALLHESPKNYWITQKNLNLDVEEMGADLTLKDFKES